MIDISYIKSFYPQHIATNAAFAKHLIKEYVELMVLDHLSHTPYIEKMSFIGGTNLRLVKGIDRFSEDIDFDCKNLQKDEFIAMTDDVVNFLRNNGLNAEARDKDNSRLTAFRRNIYFPELLFDLNLTGHREERFLLKIEAQDQGIEYETRLANVSRCGFFFPVPVPSDEVLLSMKLAALLARAKGRDFYDVIYLWQTTQPDYAFLQERCGISDAQSLDKALQNKLSTIDLSVKKRDFEHLLFNPDAADRILHFPNLIKRF